MEKEGKRGMFSPGSEGEELQETLPGLRPHGIAESADSIPTEQNLRDFFPPFSPFSLNSGSNRGNPVPFPSVFGSFRVRIGRNLGSLSQIPGKFCSFSITLGFGASKVFIFRLFLEIQASAQEKFGIFLPLATNLPLTTRKFRSFSAWFCKFPPQREISFLSCPIFSPLSFRTSIIFFFTFPACFP